MIQLLSFEEIMIMREAGKVSAQFLERLRKMIHPGISTKDIEFFFDYFISGYPGMESAFKGFSGYPASLCVSLNEEIIHGLPSSRKIVKNGDLVSVDLGIRYKGLIVDTAYTYIIGKTTGLAKRLVKTAFQSLIRAIRIARTGMRVGDIGFSVQNFVEKRGFSVIRKFVGHGVGRELHLPPEIPNFGERGRGEELKEGLVIAIEPMISAGDYDVEVLADGWTAKTKDDSLSAHFEHTVAITRRGPLILTKN